MVKIKLLAVLGATVALLAMSAAPAGAWFKSRNGTSQGQAKLISLTTLTVGGKAGAKVSCGTADGEWHLQTKGKMEERGQNEKQVAATEGPHLYVKVTKWNQCTAEVTGVKVTTGVTVSACEFQLEQPQKGVNTGTGSVITECVIKIAKPECEIKVFPGKEATNTNVFLSKISAENGQNTVLGTAEVAGIKGSAKCLSGEFTTGEFKSEKGGLVGVSLELV